MSVEQLDSIDAIGTNVATGQVAMTIMDDLRWNDEHLDTLEKKLATYVRFVEAGGLKDTYPTAEGKERFIRLWIKFRPDAKGVSFLEAARIALEKRGLGFEYGPIPDIGYSDDSA